MREPTGNQISRPKTRLREPTGNKIRKPTKTDTQDKNRKIYQAVHTRVTSGKMTEEQGAAALEKAGFPAKDNPWRASTGSTGKVLHSIAHYTGTSRADEQRRTALQAPAPVETVTKGGTVMGPVGGAISQTAFQLGQMAQDNPGGAVSLVTHPGRTAQQIGHNLKETVTDPQHHLANAALLGWAVASGGRAGIGRGLGATRALKGEGVTAPTVKNPAYTSEAVHVTTPESAAAIRAKGFDVKRGQGLGGDHYGPGVYLADKARDMGAYWRDQLATKNAVGEVATEAMAGKVGLGKPFEYDPAKYNLRGDRVGNVTPRQAIEQQRPDLLPAFDRAAANSTERQALGKTLRENGYDGLVIKHSAGDEIVAFNKAGVAFEGAKAPLGTRARAAVTRSSAKGGSLLHTPAGETTQRIWVPGGRPAPATPRPEPATPAPQWAGKKPGDTFTYRGPNGTGQGHIDAAGKPRNEKGEELFGHGNSYPVAGLKSEIKGKLASGNYEYTGPLEPLHGTPTMGSAVEGPVNALGVDRILPRNLAARPFSVARGKRIQKALYKEPGNARVLAKVKGTFSAPSTIGRERRAALRVTNAAELAKAHQQSRAVHGIFHSLNDAEHAAISVLAIEGPEAFANPAAVIARHIRTHEDLAVNAGDPARHTLRTADLKLAQKALEKPSPRLKKAAALTAQLSDETEKALIKEGLLTPEQAAGRKAKLAGIYGHTDAPAGSFYNPMSNRYTSEALGSPPGPYSPQPGKYGRGEPRTSQFLPGQGKEFTGASAKQGKFSRRVADTITDRAHRVQRLISAKRTYDELWNIGSPVKQSIHDIPIRGDAKVPQDLKEFFGRIAAKVDVDDAQAAALDASEVEELKRLLQTNVTAGVGEGVEGVRWVDQRYLADLGETNVRGLGQTIADTINNPIRTADIYLTPGYVLNLAGNLGMAGITQGVRVFPSLKKAVTAPGHQAPMIDSLVGASRSRSYGVPTGVLHKTNERLAEAWNAITDLHVRRSAFYHEAEKAGFKSFEDVDRLLADPKLRGKLTEVTRRANKNMVDYGSLTPLERNTIRRWVFFYPWVSRATVWSLRTLVEHPGKTFTLAQLGQVGAENLEDAFPGGLPRWAEGLIPFGNSKGDLQKVINLSSVNTQGTAADTIGMGVNAVKGLVGAAQAPGSESLKEAASPAVEAFAGAAGFDTGAPPGGFLGKLGVAGKVAAGLPQVQAVRRSGRFPGFAGETSKTYPETGRGPSLGPYGAHGAYPRGISRSALRTQAIKEMTPEKRAAAHVEDEEARVRAEAQRVLPKDKLPPELAQAYKTQAQRKVAYARLPNDATQQQRLEADMKLMEQLGKVTAQQNAGLRREMRGMTDNEIVQLRKKLNARFFGGELIGRVEKAVRKNGGVLTATG